MSDNKRLVKNTGYLYVRMLVVMAVSLYTSRVVLDVLGVEDYGIYNIVGGFVSMLAFLNSSLSNATQRFLSFELGKNDSYAANKVFSQSFILYVCIGLLLLLVAETVGLWFVNNKLVIPSDRLVAANYVYQLSLFSMICSILQVPYTSLIVAKERFSIYSFVSIIEVVLKLAMIFLLQKINNDSLILYSSFILINNLLIVLFYVVYSRLKFNESKIKLTLDSSYVKSILKFISYNLFGCLSYTFGSHGVNIVLNLFFGPIVNSARAISMQVNNAFLQFSNNIITALKPQIIKIYAQDQNDKLLATVIYSSKYILILMLMIGIPLLLNTDYILSIWLKEVPRYSSIFTKLVVLESLFGMLQNILWIVANATGNIKRSQLYGRLFTFMVFPISFLMLEFGIINNPVYIFAISVIAQIIYWLYSLFDIHKQVDLNYKDYFICGILPVVLSLIIVLPITCHIVNLQSINCFNKLFLTAIINVLLLVVINIMLLNAKEKVVFLQLVNNFKNKYK